MLTSDLGYVGVEFSQSVAELLHVLSEQLVGVGNTVVQVRHLVEGEATGRRREGREMTAYIYI